jgi:hypothetical protein
VHEVADTIYRINTPLVIEGAGGFSLNQYLIIGRRAIAFPHRSAKDVPVGA